MITSKSNPKVQQVRALLSRRQERDAAGVFVIEGVRLVEEVVAAGWPALMVLYSAHLSERGKGLLPALAALGADVEEVSSDLMKNLGDTETSQGILAVMHARRATVPVTFNLALVLDQLRDPGNMGTILRTATSAGVQVVFTTPGTVDPFSPKVLRAGMGAQFHLPVVDLTPEKIAVECQKGNPPIQLILAEAEDGLLPWQYDLKNPTAFVIGGEATGASENMRRAAEKHVSIPMPGRGESLNAAVAASILIYETVRQRNAG